MDYSKVIGDKVDCWVLLSPANRRWVTGLSTSFGCAIVSPTKKFYLTDFRYKIAVSTSPLMEDWNLEFIKYAELYPTIKSIVASIGANNIGIEGDQLTIDEFNELKSELAEYNLISVSKDITTHRAIKTPEEIAKITKAQSITDRAFEELLKNVKMKMTEKDIEAELVYQMLHFGASKLAFDSIVATGPNSAMCHYETGNRKLERDDVLLMDFGAMYDGFCSDMTRTVTFGKPCKQLCDIYDIVLNAQKHALANMKAGMTCSEVDAFAREYIKSYGYGDAFGHSLGHGVGIVVHEHPAVSMVSDTVLQPGMVVTCEPGIYIEGLGGVRIEDLVVVQQDGIINLTKSHKNFHID